MPFQVRLARPILVASFDEPQRMLSWSVTRPGMVTAQHVAWLEVSNRDLPEDLDAVAYARQRFAGAGLEDAVGLITSRDIRRYHYEQAVVEGVRAACLATVGLSNSERVGQRMAEPVRLPGTINMLVHVSLLLSEGAFLEAMSVATQARTTAILDAGVYRGGAAVTGTGTDCVVVAVPSTPAEPAVYAGLHTAIGEAIGAVVYRAMAAGIGVWRKDFEALSK